MYYSKGAAGISPNVVTYTTLISCCQRGGQWARGMGLFRELEQLGVEMDMKLVNAMISACAKGAKWEDAWAITSSARRMGLRPNTRTYNALISACEKAGQADRALEVFERMCKDAGRLFTSLTSIFQHVCFHVCLALERLANQAFRDTGAPLMDQQLERPIKPLSTSSWISVLAVSQPEAEPSLVTYNTLMSACAKVGYYNRVAELFRALQECSLSPDVYTLSALIQACRSRGFWEEALEFVETFDRIYSIRLNTVTCNALIATLGVEGRWQYALQVNSIIAASILLQNGAEDYCPAVVIVKLSNDRQWCWLPGCCPFQTRYATLYPCKFVDVDNSILSGKNNSGCHIALFKWQCSCISELCILAYDSVPLSVLLYAQYREVISFFMQYFEQLESGELDGRPDQWTYAAVVLALRRGGQHEKVVNMIRLMEARRVPFYKDVYFAALEACERLGLWNEGRQILQTMQVFPH